MDNKEFPEYIKELCQKKKCPGIVIFIEDYENVMDELNDQQKGLLLDSLIEYGKENIKPTLGDPLVRMAFNMCKGGIDRAAKSYEKRCERNRENAIKRWQKERERQT